MKHPPLSQLLPTILMVTLINTLLSMQEMPGLIMLTMVFLPGMVFGLAAGFGAGKGFFPGLASVAFCGFLHAGMSFMMLQFHPDAHQSPYMALPVLFLSGLLTYLFFYLTKIYVLELKLLCGLILLMSTIVSWLLLFHAGMFANSTKGNSAAFFLFFTTLAVAVFQVGLSLMLYFGKKETVVQKKR